MDLRKSLTVSGFGIRMTFPVSVSVQRKPMKTIPSLIGTIFVFFG